MATKKPAVPDNDAEHLQLAKLAQLTAEVAASNIQRYLKAHEESAFGPSKPVNRVMKISDDLTKELKDQIKASAKLAEKSLKAFTGE